MVSSEKRMQILVVDDDDTLRAALQDFLTQKGMTVNTSRDGAEAIQVIKNRAEPFDVVVTDLIMPNAGGLDVLREARNRFFQTQVVIITGYASLETAIDSMHQGAFDYVTKPFKLVEIGLILEKLQERKRLVEENQELSEKIQSLYARLDILKENRQKMEKFMVDTTDKLDDHTKKINECVSLIRALTMRIEPFLPSPKLNK
jgi:DNA-binding NtrC family response regulator